MVNVSQTKLAPANLCLWVLICHVLLGLFLAYMGCKTLLGVTAPNPPSRHDHGPAVGASFRRFPFPKGLFS